MAAKLKITQTRSTISHIARNRATVKALGLHGIGSTSTIADNPACVHAGLNDRSCVGPGIWVDRRSKHREGHHERTR